MDTIVTNVKQKRRKYWLLLIFECFPPFFIIFLTVRFTF